MTSPPSLYGEFQANERETLFQKLKKWKVPVGQHLRLFSDPPNVHTCAQTRHLHTCAPPPQHREICHSFAQSRPLLPKQVGWHSSSAAPCSLAPHAVFICCNVYLYAKTFNKRVIYFFNPILSPTGSAMLAAEPGGQ